MCISCQDFKSFLYTKYFLQLPKNSHLCHEGDEGCNIQCSSILPHVYSISIQSLYYSVCSHSYMNCLIEVSMIRIIQVYVILFHWYSPFHIWVCPIQRCAILSELFLNFISGINVTMQLQQSKFCTTHLLYLMFDQ